ncbi:hypothetical protein BaRGS_00007081 [Batillaria attramentaria]|uniref:Uncharacterized protein n=1 Tax=Batillaria attramentaria TaxID=370345 RepID=A0ABD0LQ27_9CAEN
MLENCKLFIPRPTSEYFIHATETASSVQRILNLGPAGDEARLEFIEQELYKFLVTVYPEIYKPDAPFDRLNFTEELVDAVKWKEHKTTFECTQAAVPFMDEMERLPAPNTPHLRQRFLVLRYALRDFMNSCRWK